MKLSELVLDAAACMLCLPSLTQDLQQISDQRLKLQQAVQMDSRDVISGHLVHETHQHD